MLHPAVAIFFHLLSEALMFCTHKIYYTYRIHCKQHYYLILVTPQFRITKGIFNTAARTKDIPESINGSNSDYFRDKSGIRYD